MWWILLAVVVLLLVGWALWPRKRGIVDRAALRARAADQGKTQSYSKPTGSSSPPTNLW